MTAAVAQFWASYSNLIDLCLLNAIVGYGVFLALSADMFTLATGGFMALGAYTSVLFTMQLDAPFPVALAAGGAAAVVASLLIGAPVLKLRGDYFMLATFAFTEIVRILILNLDDLTGGAIGIMNIPNETETWHLVAILLFLVVAIGLFRRSHFGLAVAAIRADDVVAQTVGVNVLRYRLVVFTVSSFILGVAGGLLAHLNFFIAPADFDLTRSIDALTYPILGGVNVLAGPIFGAAFVTAMPEILSFSNQLRELLLGALIVAIVLYLPNGALSLLQRPALVAGRRLRRERATPVATNAERRKTA